MCSRAAITAIIPTCCVEIPFLLLIITGLSFIYTAEVPLDDPSVNTKRASEIGSNAIFEGKIISSTNYNRGC